MVGDIMQPTHLLFVLVVALLVLGPKRLPEVGRQLGNGLRDFRAAINGEKSEPHEQPAAPTVTPGSQTMVAEPASESPSEHAFAHEASETVPESHEFAHEDPETVVEPQDSTPEATEPAAEHEFAYEMPESAERRTDPLN
ncbi:MAG TPA: twin-arginine translocase TatA/TatE family subunit [Solirubrobacteraceae bacterium]|nr:twin-arginine translocase TatA/TatE family subunit [Solirubrobacteraceae bacterium]